MCGIAGKIFFGKGEIKHEDIVKMAQAMVHRGPNDEGVFISDDKKVGLGHRRLSIIDLSSAGHQPMLFANRYSIVFNGEIYNFQEKKQELEKKGYQFHSKTDTEVIMALYDHYGDKCLEHMRGMFAFALYDNKENMLFCARDRVGKKPFKYFINGSVFLFASEIKAILTQKEYSKEPDYEAIHHYLTFQYVPSPMTGFKDIHKLEPGHFLKVNLTRGGIEKKCYWRVNHSHKDIRDEFQWAETIQQHLEEATKIRMAADVPVGAFLSGGVDSSAVVATMSRLSSARIKTFSIGFPEKDFDETRYARLVAKKFNTDHTELIVKPELLQEILPRLVALYEEPYADSSALPMYYVAKLAREHVTVALSGDGGDENFAGYTRYLHMRQKFPINYFPTIIPSVFSRYASSTWIGKRYSLPYQYGPLISYFTTNDKKSMYTSSFERQHQSESFAILQSKCDEISARTYLDKILALDIETYLADCLLPKVDIATMGVGLECRSPLLDHVFMEMAAKIPDSQKIQGATTKYIFKKSLEGILPHSVIHRKKMGFGIPINNWFKGEALPYARELFSSRSFSSRNIFQVESVISMLERHASNTLDNGYRIWALMTLELWFREYFDKQSTH